MKRFNAFSKPAGDGITQTLSRYTVSFFDQDLVKPGRLAGLV